MDYQIQEKQISRLKQILFPKKTQSNSRVSNNTLMATGKQNSVINNQFNIKRQIDRLKKGIQVFMSKQSQTIFNEDQTFTTPRECLEMIKYMSEHLQNHNQQIQQAVDTFLECLPKITKQNNNIRYFLEIIKFKHLSYTFSKLKRRKYGQVFDVFRIIYQQQKQQQKSIQKQTKQFRTYKQRYLRIKLSSAFSMWRRNSFQLKKVQIQHQITDSTFMRLNDSIPLLPYQGKLVTWLQKSIDSQADICEILLYNHEADTLIGYLESSQNLGSVYQTIETQQTQTDDNNPTKLKRIQFCLQHSLSKICINKRQKIKIKDIKSDIDYRNIDDMISLHGYSSRQINFGCVLTPLITKDDKQIGIIRQYYTQSIRENLNQDVIDKVAEIADNCVQISGIFQKTKQKSQAIHQKYYLKALEIIDYINSHNITITQLDNNFLEMLKTTYKFQSIIQYQYRILKNNTSANLHVQITILNTHDNPNYQQAITALQKMHKVSTSAIISTTHFYIRTATSIYQIHPQNMLKISKNLTNVLTTIFQQKQASKTHKKNMIQKQKHQQQLQKQRLQKQRQMKMKNIIRQFCGGLFESENVEAVCRKIQMFLKEFMGKYLNKLEKQYRVIFKNRKNLNNKDLQIIMGNQYSYCLQCQIAQNLQILPIYLIQSLKSTFQLLYNKLIKPIVPTITKSSLNQIFYSQLNFTESPQTMILKIMKKITKQQQNSIKIYKIDRSPFESQNFICYSNTQYNITEQNMGCNDMIKFLRKQTYIETDQLMQQCPKMSIICLNNQLIIILKNYYYLSAQNLDRINRLYIGYKQQQNYKKQCNSMLYKQQIFMKMYQILANKYHYNVMQVFNEIKMTRKQKQIPQLLTKYIQNMNRQCIRYGFNKITYKTHKILNLNHAQNLLKKSVKCYLKSQYAHTIFVKYYKYQKFIKCTKILSSKLVNLQHKHCLQAISNIHDRAHRFRPNHFKIFDQLAWKQYFYAFQKIMRISLYTKYNSESKQTDFSKISKMDSILQLSRYLSQQYNQYYIILDHGDLYTKIHNRNIQTCQNIQNHDQQNFIQIPCNINTNQRILKNILWFTSSDININQICLTDKHYLKVISKGIQQCYRKNCQKNTALLIFLQNFMNKKSQQFKKYSMNKILNFSLIKIKSQQYQNRKKYYQYSIENENLKIMEHQAKKQANHRQNQIQELKKQIRKWQQIVSKNRKNIVRLDVSNNKLQQLKIRSGFQETQIQLKRLFTIWRKKSLIISRQIIQKKTEISRKEYPLRRILTIMKYAYHNRIQQSMNRIKLKSEKQLIKISNLESKIMSQTKNKVMENIDNVNGRLMTFQDQLNSQEETLREKGQQLDISIIPISFKHFDKSQLKQNVQVTDQQLKKINNGAYKLNPKTVKFLKRMGKINNQNRS